MIPQRLDFAFHIDWSGDWHVGSGFSSASADRLLRRVGGVHGTPFVPGSQFKGVLRHQCERLALALGCEAVDPHATSDDQRKRLVTHFRPLADSALLVDRLFGNRYQGECLFVDNALPAEFRAMAIYSANDPRRTLNYPSFQWFREPGNSDTPLKPTM